MPKQFREKVKIYSGVSDTSGLSFEHLKAESADKDLPLGVNDEGEVVEQTKLKQKEFKVEQPSHGFSSLDPIYFDGQWKKADESHPATHVVGKVKDTGEFQAIGPIPKKAEGHGFAIGSTVYQNGDTLSTTKPAVPHCVGQAYTADTIMFHEHIACRSEEKHRAYSVRILKGVSNPDDAVVYADKALGMNPADEKWDTLFGHKPCLFKDGAVVKYLDPDDFSKDVDGGDVDLTDKSLGDIMIEFPRRGVKIEKEDNGDIVVSMTEYDGVPGYSYKAHMRGEEQVDNFYLGAYMGVYEDSKLRSLSDKTPKSNITLNDARTKAQANGDNYQTSGWYQLIYRQVMYLLKYKTLQSQGAVGKGNIKGGNIKKTGVCDRRGMDWGNKEGTDDQVKIFGVEDMWGNLWEWIDGVYCNSSKTILTATGSFNSTGSGYFNTGTKITSPLGYIKSVVGNNDAGFVMESKGTNGTTYYCDGGKVEASKICRFGSDNSNNSVSTTGPGAFHIHFTETGSSKDSKTGARLMYL